MDIVVCAVGRLGPGPERELVDRFAKRVRWPLAIREVAGRRKLPARALAAEEARLLDAACPEGAVRVVLDRAGEMLESAELARRMGAWRDAGRSVAFVVGGAEGLAPALRDGADLVLGFGRATWPHKLARAMLMEQIYRAQEILAGRPYPRG